MYLVKKLVFKSFYSKILSIALIVCLGIIVYSNSFFCPFHFDDNLFIVQNSSIKNIYNLENIWHYFHGRFFTFLSIALNYYLNGLNVFGYHLFNITVHLTSAVLVWWLTLLTISTPAMKNNKITQHADLVALFTGLVFVSHPVQTEAVSYIWQRAASMAALFYLASLCFYVKSRLLQENIIANGLKIKLYYSGALLAAVVAMFTKENTITLPLMILIYEFMFLRTKQAFEWKYIGPFLTTLFIIPITLLFLKTQVFQSMHGELRTYGGVITPIDYLLTQFRVMFTYIRLVFVPVNQDFYYDYPIIKNVFEIPFLISFLSLLALFYWAFHLISKYKLLAFFFFWFFLTLTIPESSIWAMGNVILEHRLYLPLAGYSIFLVSGIFYLFGKNSIYSMVIVLSLIIACNSVLTYQRNKVWKDDWTLWDDVLQKASSHKPRLYYIRGSTFYQHGNFNQALTDLSKAIELSPEYADAYKDRSFIYAQQGDFTNAMSDYNKAIELNPDYNIYRTNFAKEGDYKKNISFYNKAVEMSPGQAEVYINRGLVYYKFGHWIEAIFDFTKAIEINPEYAQAYAYRGSVYGEGDNFTQAISDFTKAININPSDSNAYYNRAGTYYQLKEYDKAWADVFKAQRLGAVINSQFISALKQMSGKN